MLQYYIINRIKKSSFEPKNTLYFKPGGYSGLIFHPNVKDEAYL